MTQHLTEYADARLGPVVQRIAELVPGGEVAIELLVIDTPEARLVLTSGMSALAGPEGSVRAEALLRLPAGWPVDPETATDETWWPLAMLRQIGRLPGAAFTPVGAGSTVISADPPVPWGAGTALSCAVLLPSGLPALGAEDAAGEPVHVLTAVPIHFDELDVKALRGAGMLAVLMRAHGLQTAALDPARASVAGREDGIDVARVVPVIERDDEALLIAQAQMGEWGIDPDEALNGAWLPVGEIDGLYTSAYLAELGARLRATAATGEDPGEALWAIRRELELGTFPR